jgi:hypothetical protein
MISMVKLRALCLVSLGVFASATAHAQTATQVMCAESADQGQTLRDKGKLRGARELFVRCAASECPAVVAKDCSEWLEQVDREIGSIAFLVRDENGREILDVRVFIDGVKWGDAIDGRAVPLDPGEHVVRLERADGTSLEKKFVLRPTEKNRIVDLSFGHPSASEPAEGPPRSRFRVPLLGWVGLGVTGAGALTAVTFAILANNDESDLRSSCAPYCSSADRSSIDTKVVVANIGLGVGIAGLALAVTSTVLANKSRPKRPAVSLAPSSHGASLSLNGWF